MIKNSDNFCYKLDFAAATLAETLRQAQKREVGKRLHRRGLAHSLSEVMFNASSAALACKGPQARKPLQWCKRDTFWLAKSCVN